MSLILGILDSGGAAAPSLQASTVLSVSFSLNPCHGVYPWSASGFGTRYASASPQPGGPTIQNGFESFISKSNNLIGFAHSDSPYVSVYDFNVSTGIGTKYSNPGTLPPADQSSGIDFTGDVSAIGISSYSSPYINAYPWSSGFGTKYSNPATAAGTQGNRVRFGRDGASIAIAGSGTPFLHAYPFNTSTGFGTKYSNPATLPGAGGTGLAFTRAGDFIGISTEDSPYLAVYPWSSSSGYGTKVSDPASGSGGRLNSIAWDQSDSVVVAQANSPTPHAWAWSSSGFGTKYSSAPTLPDNGLDAKFNGDNTAIAIAHVASPYVSVYAWSAGWGTKFTNPATLPTGTGRGVYFNNTK